MSLFDKIEYDNWLTSRNIDIRYECGDYSYGTPEILNFSNDFSNLKIGKFCSIADNVKIILGGKHNMEWVTTFPMTPFFDIKQPEYKINNNKIIIGNDVWISFGVTILSGVTIGDGAVIGAGSVVTKDIPPYAFVAGNPAKIIRYRFKEQEIKELLKIEWWNWDIEKIKEASELFLSENISKFIKIYGVQDEK